MVKLTPRQKAFADEYIICGNATEAAKRAGYKIYKSSGVEANKTLKNPNVAEYIKKRQKEIEDSRIASAAEIMQYLTAVMRDEVKDSKGKKIATKVEDRTKAAIELAKRKIDIKDTKQNESRIVIVNNIPRPNKSD